ncbi:hypothetical protein [Streptomyces sp. NPDC001744]|uniref:hypothetical protein n=1 Tax=Streptomyces sp. NPDC001744 TaxID=3364606 RepID=UPI0036B65B4D
MRDHDTPERPKTAGSEARTGPEAPAGSGVPAEAGVLVKAGVPAEAGTRSEGSPAERHDDAAAAHRGTTPDTTGAGGPAAETRHGPVTAADDPAIDSPATDGPITDRPAVAEAAPSGDADRRSRDGRPPEGAGPAEDEDAPALFGLADEDAYRGRWREIQGRFVDDPREAVHSADALVADVMRALADVFADHKRTLEGQWSEGRDADTESLRLALREYRSFFHRLLST